MIWNDAKIWAELEGITNALDDLKHSIGERRDTTKDVQERVADLEVKMSKLWALLIEVNPYGKEKLSKVGRRWGGAARATLQ